MFNSNTSIPMALGSARQTTRAVSRGETMELNPLLFYSQTGAGQEALQAGAASQVTRAVGGGEEAELNPIYDWTPPGAHHN